MGAGQFIRHLENIFNLFASSYVARHHRDKRQSQKCYELVNSTISIDKNFAGSFCIYIEYTLCSTMTIARFTTATCYGLFSFYIKMIHSAAYYMRSWWDTNAHNLVFKKRFHSPATNACNNMFFWIRLICYLENK